MAVFYKSLAVFARSLEVCAHSVKKLDHHIHISRPMKNGVSLCIWAMRELSLVGMPFQFILKPLDDPDVIIHTDASSLVGRLKTFLWFFFEK